MTSRSMWPALVFVVVAAVLTVATVVASPGAATVEEANELCDTPHGTILGYAFGQPAYSNCREGTVSNESHEFTHDGNKVVTGLKWQCVEFARRSLLVRHNLVFDDVESAHDLWFLQSVGPPFDDFHRVPLARHLNGRTIHTPQPHDTLIWRVQEGMPYGHVAIVVSVVGSEVRIADQNYVHRPWAHANYSRSLQISHPKKEAHDLAAVTLTDPDGYALVGWMRPMVGRHHPGGASHQHPREEPETDGPSKQPAGRVAPPQHRPPPRASQRDVDPEL